MRILTVGVTGRLDAAVRATLRPGQELIAYDGDLLDVEALGAAAGAADAVVVQPDATDRDAGVALLDASAPVHRVVTTVRRGARVVLLSSLRLFERYPVDQKVSEFWRPLPTTATGDLVPFIAETVVREAAQELPISAVCLRLGELVGDDAAPDRRALHVDDAARAIQLALEFTPEAQDGSSGWWVFHIVGAGDTRFPSALASVRSPYPNGGRVSSLGYRPRRDVASGAPFDARPARPPTRIERTAGTAGHRRLVIFGAGGPFGAAAAERLADRMRLRLTDRRPYAEVIATAAPQSPGAPVPVLWAAPRHETAVVDVADRAQVLTAMNGADVALNLTVVRDHPIDCFRVNTVGALNVLRAAVETGVRRVVLTGPNQVFNPMPGAYWSDFGLGSDLPQRPGAHVYMLSKHLGQELARVFAQEHGLEIVSLVFGYFADPVTSRADPFGAHPFTVSWDDTGEAMARAVLVPSYPHPFEVLHVQGMLPHGKYRTDRIREVLGWAPADDLRRLWTRDDSGWAAAAPPT